MDAKYSTFVNEPSKDIIDGIHNGRIAGLTTDVYGCDHSAILVVEYFCGRPITSLDDIEKVDRGKITFRLGVRLPWCPFRL